MAGTALQCAQAGSHLASGSGYVYIGVFMMVKWFPQAPVNVAAGLAGIRAGQDNTPFPWLLPSNGLNT